LALTMADLADLTFTGLTQSIASAKPTPGAGPSLACTSAIAAALLEMVTAVALNKDPPDPAAVQARHDRAAALRLQALSLADLDIAAYENVLAVQRRRDEPGHAQRLREALLEAADPIVAIVETAAELAMLAADAAAQARGGVRGEAVTAVTLAAAVAQAGAPLVEFNLGGARDDPRLDQVRRAAQRAREACDRSRVRA
jgi:formiminotetrahydrofolate cyclodeaminase